MSPNSKKQETASTRGKPGRPPSERPRVRSAISMRAEDADLIHTVLVHATKEGVVDAPPSRLNGQPFAGLLGLVKRFCDDYATKNALEIERYEAPVDDSNS